MLVGCLSPIMPNQPVSDMFFEVTHNVCEGIIGVTLDDDVDVVGHDDEGIQLEPLTKAHTIQAVYD